MGYIILGFFCGLIIGLFVNSRINKAKYPKFNQGLISITISSSFALAGARFWIAAVVICALILIYLVFSYLSDDWKMFENDL